MKTVGDFITDARDELKTVYESSEIQRIIILLLEEVKGLGSSASNFKSHEIISDEEMMQLEKYIYELNLHKPIQYVLGHAWFYGLKFLVNEHVLIPRPETEELCEWIISGNRVDKKLEILDIGTGSGCIAITLKKKLPSAKVSAIDISDGALQTATQNAILNNTDVTFLKGDILLKQQMKISQTKFDIIVSNPPYIRKNEMSAMNSSVKDFEPHLALFVDGEDPLIFYSSIADFAKQHLNADGKLFFEINQELGEGVVKLLNEKGFAKVELRKDMSGNNRMVAAVV
jgi:release factor glutamine methyltransferase